MVKRSVSIPFRLLAIVETADRLRRMIDEAGALRGAQLGVMLRDAAHDPARVLALADVAASLPIPPEVTVISNGTIAPGARGAHWPASTLDAATRLERPAGGIAGCSAHSLDEALRAEAAGADYITFSPVFPTSSKPGHPGAGVDLLARICRAATIPVFALGGITPERISLCLDAGAHGIASISLFHGRDWPDRVPAHFENR